MQYVSCDRCIFCVLNNCSIRCNCCGGIDNFTCCSDDKDKKQS